MVGYQGKSLEPGLQERWQILVDFYMDSIKLQSLLGWGRGAKKGYRWRPCRELEDSKNKLHSLCKCTHLIHKYAPSPCCISARDLKERWVTRIPSATDRRELPDQLADSSTNKQ